MTINTPMDGEKTKPPQHTMGYPLRACVFKYLLELVAESLPKHAPFAQQLKLAIDQPPAFFTNIIFRAMARHKEPMETKVCTWAFIIADSIDADGRTLLKNLMSIEIKDCCFT